MPDMLIRPHPHGIFMLCYLQSAHPGRRWATPCLCVWSLMTGWTCGRRTAGRQYCRCACVGVGFGGALEGRGLRVWGVRGGRGVYGRWEYEDSWRAVLPVWGGVGGDAARLPMGGVGGWDGGTAGRRGCRLWGQGSELHVFMFVYQGVGGGEREQEGSAAGMYAECARGWQRECDRLWQGMGEEGPGTPGTAGRQCCRCVCVGLGGLGR